MWKLLLVLPAFVAVATPARAPAPQSLAYVSDKGGIVLVDVDGRHERVLRGTSNAFDFAWSPDGRRLVFSASGPSGDSNLWLVGADGSGRRRLTNDGASSSPVWARDGRQIYYTSYGGEWSVLPSGAQKHRLPHDHAPVGGWSPDGKLVAESAEDARGRVQIWVSSADGTNDRQLTHNTKTYLGPANVSFSQPVWSPDGRTLAFSRDSAHGSEVEVIGSDGKGLRRLATSSSTVPADPPSWSPDGSWIAFTRITGANSEDVFLIHPDGRGLRRLTRGASAFSPAWRPQRR